MSNISKQQVCQALKTKGESLTTIRMQKIDQYDYIAEVKTIQKLIDVMK
jgi:hypothetical protein